MRSAKYGVTSRDTWMWTKRAKNYKQRGVSWGFNPVIKLQFIYIYITKKTVVAKFQIAEFISWFMKILTKKNRVAAPHDRWITFHDSHNRGKISPTHFTPQTYLKGCLHVYPNFYWVYWVWKIIFSVLQDTAPELLLAAVFKEDWALMGRYEKFLSNPRGLHMKITGINGWIYIFIGIDP